jgi:hypothetical protein
VVAIKCETASQPAHFIVKLPCGLYINTFPPRTQRRYGSDRVTRQSEQSDGLGRGRTGYKQPIVWPPAFRRLTHRLDTRGQPPVRGTSSMCNLFVRFCMRHALKPRRPQPPLGLLFWCQLLLRFRRPPLEAQFTSEAGPWHLFGLPHNAPARGYRPGLPQVAQTYKLHLHHGGKRREDRECLCVREMQKTQSALRPLGHFWFVSKVGFSGMWSLHSG